ncbi:Zinc finger C2HC domain-containing protein 1A [Tritrichomonas musculus]|uniref:Zinc finger C2HC domain-containing protein 1A n=1 Tax=Tritrichomonas musculus TaxID=1915356 RepID=A0ABR2K6N0_9EUKA
MFNSWTTDDVCDQLSSNGFDYAVAPFTKNAVTGDLLQMITEDHLKEMGIQSIGKRLLLLQWIRDTAGVASPPSSAKPARSNRPEFKTGDDEYDQVPPPKMKNSSYQDSQSSSRQTKTGSSQKKTQQQQAPASKNENVPKCKRDHDKMVEQIRAARKYAAYEKAVEEGRAVGPPPELPPIEEPEGLVPCPYCGRKFGEEAAKHHIPVCERMNAKRGNPRGKK